MPATKGLSRNLSSGYGHHLELETLRYHRDDLEEGETRPIIDNFSRFYQTRSAFISKEDLIYSRHT